MLGRHEASVPIILGDRETLLGVLCLSCSPTQALDARYALLAADGVGVHLALHSLDAEGYSGRNYG